MSALSDYLNAHLPAGWSRRDVVKALAEVLDQSTVYRYLGGNHTSTPPEYVLQAFAAALPGVSVVELRRAAGQAAGEEEPWVLPPEAQRLSRAQRAVVEQLIHVFLNPPEAPAARDNFVSGEAHMRAYLQQLRDGGHGELADRLAAFLAMSSASDTASKSSSC